MCDEFDCEPNRGFGDRGRGTEEIDPGEPDPTDEPGEEIGTPVLVDAGPKLDESCIGVVCDKAKKESAARACAF